MTLPKITLKKNYQIPTYPIGWFVIAESSEVANGEILKRTFCGKDVVVFRTESGKAAVTDAYCPHMGAHLGHGGCVEGEDIRCPFHGFKFNTDGNCTATGYGTKPSPRAKLFAWPVMEKFGLIFAFYHPEQKAPHFTVKDIDTEGWTPFKVHTWELPSNPIEISENSVDIGHFVHIHGFRDPYSRCDLTLNGPLLYAEYGFYRRDFVRKSNWINVEIEIYQQGLGFALVEAVTKDYGIRTRHLVMPTAIKDGMIHLRVASSVKHVEEPGRIMSILKFFPKKLLTNIIARSTFKEYCAEVYADFKVWENKIYVHPPALSKGDGPVMQYRQWAAQFDHQLVSNLEAPASRPE